MAYNKNLLRRATAVRVMSGPVGTDVPEFGQPVPANSGWVDYGIVSPENISLVPTREIETIEGYVTGGAVGTTVTSAGLAFNFEAMETNAVVIRESTGSIVDPVTGRFVFSAAASAGPRAILVDFLDETNPQEIKARRIHMPECERGDAGEQDLSKGTNFNTSFNYNAQYNQDIKGEAEIWDTALITEPAASAA